MDSLDASDEIDDEQEIVLVPTLSSFCLTQLARQKDAMQLFLSLVDKPVPPPDNLYTLACEIVRYSPDVKKGQRAINLLRILITHYQEYTQKFLNMVGPIIIESEMKKQQRMIPSLFDPTKVKEQVARSLKNKFRKIAPEYRALLRNFFSIEQTKFAINYFQQKLCFEVPRPVLREQIGALPVTQYQKRILNCHVEDLDSMAERSFLIIFALCNPFSWLVYSSLYLVYSLLFT